MLSQMFRQLFMGNPLIVFPVLALGIFMGTFFIVSVRVFANRSRAFDDLAKLPLDDGEVRRDR